MWTALSFSLLEPPPSLLSKTRKEEIREGEREKGLILVTIKGGWEGKKESKNEGRLREKAVQGGKIE